MLNYYDILETDRSADQTAIKNAYKQLALMWHPDKNPGSVEAEEKFKLINEAYQVLSDPDLRRNYDDRLDYLSSRRPIYTPPVYTTTSSSSNRPYGYDQPPIRRTHGYVIDKEYFRIQRIILLIFFGLIGAAYSLSLIKDFIANHNVEAMIAQNEIKMDSARMKFDGKEYDEALSMINSLIKNNVTQYSYYNARDTMLSTVQEMAILSFQAKNYARAADMFEIVKKYEWISRLSTLRYLSLAQTRAGRQEEALRLLTERLSEEPENLSLLYHLSLVHMIELNDPKNASPYLSTAVKIFKETHTKMYGAAFEMAVRPENIPDIYYDIFNLRSKVNFELSEFEESYTDCNWAIFIRGENIEPYMQRVNSGIKAGETSRICRDLNKIVSMGEEIDRSKFDYYCNDKSL